MSKEIKVALFVIVMVVIAVLGGKFLKGSSVFATTNTYYAVFDNVMGLNSSDQVVVNGYPVGTVGSLTLINEGENKGLIQAELIVEKDIKIPVKSEAVLFAVDLLGEMSVKLEYSDETALLEDGDIILAKKEADMIGAITEELTPLTDQLNVTLANFNKLFDFEQQNKQSLNYTLETLNETMETFNQTGIIMNRRLDSQLESLDNILANFEKTTATLNANEENITEIVSNFTEISSTLKEVDIEETITNVNTALEGINVVLAKAQSTDNTLGAILNDRTLYENFEKASVDLDLLLKDVRFNPQRYVNISVFGKKDKGGPLLGEDEVQLK